MVFTTVLLQGSDSGCLIGSQQRNECGGNRDRGVRNSTQLEETEKEEGGDGWTQVICSFSQAQRNNSYLRTYAQAQASPSLSLADGIWV